MPIDRYPFLKLGKNSPYRPILYIRVTNPHTSLYIDIPGLIDTGADHCALPAGFADLLGHNLQSGQSREISTANGVTLAYAHTCRMEIFDTISLLNGKQKFIYTLDHTPIDFMPNLHCALLGVSNFLNRFTLSLDYPKQVFSLRK